MPLEVGVCVNRIGTVQLESNGMRRIDAGMRCAVAGLVLFRHGKIVARAEPAMPARLGMPALTAVAFMTGFIGTLLAGRGAGMRDGSAKFHYLTAAVRTGRMTPNQARAQLKLLPAIRSVPVVRSSGTVGIIEACRFAGIDPDRLNEAIAAGLYQHAPPTRAGSRRRFAANDLVPLRVFADLCRFGFSRQHAGDLVGQLLNTGEVFDKSKTIQIKFDLYKIETDALRVCETAQADG